MRRLSPVYHSFGAPRSVRDIPARSLAVAMADRSGGTTTARAKSHTRDAVAAVTARLLATYAAVASTFAHLKTAVHAGFGEPNREPAATDSERRQAISGNHRCS